MSSVEYRSNPFSRSYQNPIQWKRNGSTLLYYIMPDSGAPGKRTIMKEFFPLFQLVTSLMPHEFDAHEFILEFIKQNPYAYFSVLHAADEIVALANAQISKYLSDHSEELNIVYTGRKHESPDIFRNSAECAMFERK